MRLQEDSEYEDNRERNAATTAKERKRKVRRESVRVRWRVKKSRANLAPVFYMTKLEKD